MLASSFKMKGLIFMKEEILKIINKYDENNDAECKEEIEELLVRNGIQTIEIEIENTFDSPGYDVYSVAVAWIEKGKLQLVLSYIGLGW